MRQFAGFIRKEFLHILRDKRTLSILFAMPVIQLLIFGYAITNEFKNTSFAVVDRSKSEESRQLIAAIDNGKYFDLYSEFADPSEAENYLIRGKVKLVLVIPSDFADMPDGYDARNVQLLTDASEPNEATTVASYAQQMITQYTLDRMSVSPAGIKTEIKMLYNSQMKSAYNFVPGIMGLILMLICAMMTSIAIVREKEQGTMEILLVSPVKPIQVVVSKIIPYMLIAMLDVALILSIACTVLEVPIAGGIFSLTFLACLFTLSALAFGLLISSVTDTQQTAMIISGAGVLLPTILLSGLIFPLENMPLFLRLISNVLPAKWFIAAVRDVMIKGLPLAGILKECAVLAVMSAVLLLAGVKRFKSRL